MKKLLFGLLFVTLIFSCENKITHHEVYDLMKVCSDDFYQAYNISPTKQLELFEQTLIDEGFLKNTTFTAYLSLIKKLEKESYFNGTLGLTIKSTEPLLRLSPTYINTCLTTTFNLDQKTIEATNYFKLEKKINQYISETAQPSMNVILNFYASEITASDFESEYVKQQILLQLYRWYYVSKYEQVKE